MKNVLFVTEKWCDFNPDLGFTNTMHNFYKTLSTYGQCKYNSIHTDEAQLVYGKHIDDVLIDYVNSHPTDIIIFSLVNHIKYDPSIECYRKLREKGIYLCVLWPDTGPDWGLQTIQKLKPHINLHISYDNPYPIGGHWNTIYDRSRFESNHLCLWTPEDDSMYYPEEKTIDISLLGSSKLYLDRLKVKDILKERYSNIYIGGGQREGRLTPEQYAFIIRKSKIGINFSLSQTGVFYQAKGRIFEYTASKTMLLDFYNPSTEDYYKVNIDYIGFSTVENLLHQIDFFIKNKKEREIIAQQGYNTFKSNWTSNHWWEIVLNRINKEINNE